MNNRFLKQLIIEIENGRKLAKVPLGKIAEHGWASLWASDLAELIALGVSLNWTIAMVTCSTLSPITKSIVGGSPCNGGDDQGDHILHIER
jgi:hypothetical protein